MVICVRKKINITIDEALLAQLKKEMKQKNLSLSRLIENKLKDTGLEARVKKLEERVFGKESESKNLEA
jgi:hypothetical protein